MTEPANLSYCARQLWRHDRDRFLIALYAPPDRREALFAIHAFNLEVARTREVVTEETLGLIRLQWWRDALDGVYRGQPARHEVLEALAPAVARFGLGRRHFDTVLAAREADLTERAPADLAALERYAEDTAAPLIRLSLEVLGVPAEAGATAEAAHDAATAIGTAWAMTGLLRAVPFHARRRRVTLPTALVEEVAVEMGELFELRPHAGLAQAVARLAARAAEHLRHARGRRRRVPRAAVPALLPATLAGAHLATLRRAGHDVFDPSVQRPTGPLAQARLMINASLGRY